MCSILRSPVYIELFPDMEVTGDHSKKYLKFERFLKLKVPNSHRGGVEDDLRVIAVISGYHLSRESGQSWGGWWLGHHGSLLGLE